MKIKIALLSIAFLLLISGSAFSQWTRHRRYIGDKVYEFKVSDEDLKNTPVWNPEEEAPPVSLRQATRIARTNLKRFVPEKFNQWYILDEIKLFKEGDKWLYSVTFDCRGERCF